MFGQKLLQIAVAPVGVSLAVGDHGQASAAESTSICVRPGRGLGLVEASVEPVEAAAIFVDLDVWTLGVLGQIALNLFTSRATLPWPVRLQKKYHASGE